MTLTVADVPNGYWFTAADLPTLQTAAYYNEKTANESDVIRDYLLQHGAEYDKFGINVRVGLARTPDPTHLLGVQKSTIYSSRKRIDLVGIKGTVHTLIEAKQKIEPSALGQLLTYRRLYLADNPGVTEAPLIAIGRYTDTDTQESLNAHGVKVILYTEAPSNG